MDANSIYKKTEHFKDVIRANIGMELLDNSTDLIKLTVEDTVKDFNLKANQFIVSSLLKLEIDPDIVRKQIIAIKELKEENEILKEENKELRDENMRWKSLVIPTRMI